MRVPARRPPFSPGAQRTGRGTAGCGRRRPRLRAPGAAGAGRPHPARSQASALYLFAYYLGGSVGGSTAGLAYEHGRWPGTVRCAVALVAAGAPAARRLPDRAVARVPAGRTPAA